VEASALREYLTVVAEPESDGSARYKSLLLKKFSLQSTREFPVRLLRESDRNSLNLLAVRARKIEQRA
jgi:hypothetical protein